MSEENKNTQLVLPASVNLSVDAGKWAQEEAIRLQKENKQIDGVMLIDTLAQKKVIKEEVPKYEKATKLAENLSVKLNARAKKAVADLKKDDKALELKEAINSFGFSINIVPEFIGIDLDVEGVNTIKFKWVIKEAGQYGDTMDSDEDDLPIPADMKDMLDKYWEARKEAKRANDAVVEAQDLLFNRANRTQDAKGAHAILNMTDEERAQANKLYEAVKDGVKLEKLLAAGKK